MRRQDPGDAARRCLLRRRSSLIARYGAIASRSAFADGVFDWTRQGVPVVSVVMAQPPGALGAPGARG